ncbi:hypothetical protein EYE40_08150 [Glaciihabitans arcticus]|uniref:Uncharacterized protein n=1 Tax=Glaciihabitans arcticus TaxID=2668039 RepID=A0A4Q9GRU3_9MICO|nr:hypothetical protein [Glaciihabitans arcticus]TBN57371.1 hypothetical protein EYE40_08150 [Glaciihabitans arcticus]
MSSIAFDFVKEEDGEDFFVKILVDGVDLRSYGALRDETHATFAQPFFQEGARLVPPFRSRRLFLYTCDCGFEGCSDVAPRIEEVPGGLVRWSDFRQFTGYDWGEAHQIRTRGRALAVDDLYFDAEQYRAEVERALADQSWHTPAMRREAALREAIEPLRSRVANAGFRLGWVSSWPRTACRVLLESPGDMGDEVVLITVTGDCDEEIARSAFEQLHALPVREWPRE